MPFPYNEMINSFREWDHFNEPGTGEPDAKPSHRFWTWGKLDRIVGTAAECKGGVWYGCTQDDLDDIFDCDKPYLDDVLEKGIHRIEASLDDLPQGVYFYVLNSKVGRISGTLIKE